MFNKGDVLRGHLRTRDKARHPLIYWEGDMVTHFIGVMLTHSGGFPDNQPLSDEHFLTHDEQGQEFPFQWNDTHFVSIRFLKPNEWGPYTKIGQMTFQGIDFMEAQLPDMKPLLWDEYAARRSFNSKRLSFFTSSN